MPRQLPYKLAVLNSHPIQYFAPMYRRIAQEPQIDLTVFYCSRQGVDAYLDPGFKQIVQWDTNLLDGYKYRFLPNLRRSDSVGGLLSLINPSIVEELNRERFDALWIHGHNYFTYLLAIAAARLLQIPVLMRCETHLLLQRSSWKRLIRRPVMTWLYQNCAGFLAIGTRNAEFYQYHGVSDTQIKLVPYTVDNDYFIGSSSNSSVSHHEVRTALGLSPHTPIILYASKLSPRKRPLDVLEAYHRLREKSVDAALLLIGSGSEEATLRHFTVEQKLERVYFLGFLNQSELPKWYSAADMFVLPSANEPWGLIINEAMCAGLPIVASEEIGAVPDLVHEGENGFTFRCGDIDTLTSKLELLCINADLRQRMADASLRIIRQWNYEKVVEGVLATLDKLTR